MDVLHTALWVTDIEATKEFYLDGLGLDYSRSFIGDDGVTNYYVTGSSDAEIQFRYDEVQHHAPQGGFDHIALGVHELDSLIETLVEHYGSRLVDGPRTVDASGVRVAFLTDPDGYRIELIQQLES